MDLSSQLKNESLLARITDVALTSSSEPIGIDFAGKNVHVINPTESPVFDGGGEWQGRYNSVPHQKYIAERTPQHIRRCHYGIFVLVVPSRKDVIVHITHGSDIFLTHVTGLCAQKSLVEYAKDRNILVSVPVLSVVQTIKNT